MPIELTRPTPTTLLVRRSFAQDPKRIYWAHTDPQALSQWMLGPTGWRMTTLIYDARPNGKIDIAWELDGARLRLVGTFLELDPPHRTLHRERYLSPEASSETRVETRFLQDGAGTQLAMTLTMPSAAEVDAMLQTPMAEGMEASYARLDTL